MESMFRGTTICGVKKDGKIAIAGDGQVTMSESVIFKSNAHKVRRIYSNENYNTINMNQCQSFM